MKFFSLAISDWLYLHFFSMPRWKIMDKNARVKSNYMKCVNSSILQCQFTYWVPQKNQTISWLSILLLNQIIRVKTRIKCYCLVFKWKCIQGRIKFYVFICTQLYLYFTHSFFCDSSPSAALHFCLCFHFRFVNKNIFVFAKN